MMKPDIKGWQVLKSTRCNIQGKSWEMARFRRLPGIRWKVICSGRNRCRSSCRSGRWLISILDEHFSAEEIFEESATGIHIFCICNTHSFQTHNTGSFHSETVHDVPFINGFASVCTSVWIGITSLSYDT